MNPLTPEQVEGIDTKELVKMLKHLAANTETPIESLFMAIAYRMKSLEENLERFRNGQDHAVMKAIEYERARLAGIIKNEAEYPTDWPKEKLAEYAKLIADGEADVLTFVRIAVAETKRSLLEKLK